MKIVIAPDSFKESLAAIEVAQAIDLGIKAILPHAETVLLPVADGGEGTVEALVHAGKGKYTESSVNGPLGGNVNARWGIVGSTAVIEMAAASGLPLLSPHQRNPLHTSTQGTGQLIKAAMDAGCTKIILGLGGSATNDGGAGAISALGCKLLDDQGQPIAPGAQGLLALKTIDTRGVDPRLAAIEIEIACDVNNALLGPEGAASIFGPQKGADQQMIPVLDAALARLADVALEQSKDIASFPGSGAAGGLAAGLSLIANIRLRPGIQLILEAIRFSQHVKDAGLVLTAEGKIDAQSAMGKAIGGVGQLAQQARVPTLALCGAVGDDYSEVYETGIAAVIPIVDAPMSLNQAMASTSSLLTATAERIMRILTLSTRP